MDGGAPLCSVISACFLHTQPYTKVKTSQQLKAPTYPSSPARQLVAIPDRDFESNNSNKQQASGPEPSNQVTHVSDSRPLGMKHDRTREGSHDCWFVCPPRSTPRCRRFDGTGVPPTLRKVRYTHGAYRRRFPGEKLPRLESGGS